MRFYLKTSALILSFWIVLNISVSGQALSNLIKTNNLYGLKIDAKETLIKCRTIPFLATTNYKQIIPVGHQASTLYLLGMINSWDLGLAHWGEHPELREKRDDQVQIGSKLGDIEICYIDNTSEKIPVVIGYTAWFFNSWKNASHSVKSTIREPFASRPEYMKVLRDALQVKENGEFMEANKSHMAYYLPVTPKNIPIKSIVIHDNPDIRGDILVSGVTLQLQKNENVAGSNLVPFGKQSVDKSDLEPAFATSNIPDYSTKLKALSGILYTGINDLPKKVDLIDFPADFKGSKIRFLSDKVEGDMLSNMWVANLLNINEKFESESGFFYETGVASPFYGGYSGIGTWAPAGVYRQAYSRTTDHYVRLALRNIDNKQRVTNFVDFCDKWLYFYRADHNPLNGPVNNTENDISRTLDVTRYPKDAPPHWAFVMDHPAQIPSQINEIEGDEEMEGHSSTIVSRWYSWKLMGKPTDDWMTKPREEVYNKSRWQSSKDAADFICWLIDYTGRDVIYSEGEFTGWGGKWSKITQIPLNMDKETDKQKIRDNYANSDMYGVYASYTSYIGLLCSEEMAKAMGEATLAKKYKDYADRIRNAMLRLLAVGPDNNRTWRVTRNSVLPSLQDCLVQTWYSLYKEGLDPQKMDEDMTPISRNTLKSQLNQRYGDAPVLAMGYGIGWLTHSALVLDQMDNAGRLLINIARYSYDKNMDWVDEKQKKDWRKWMWIIPEGSNIMPDGRWYRICDLSNGANQGPAMNAMEICAGVDDAKSERVRLLPRIPDPLTGLEVSNFQVITSDGIKNISPLINYTYERGKSFKLKSNIKLPKLDIRFGPYTNREQADKIVQAITSKGATNARVEQSGIYHGKLALWVWVENLESTSEYILSAEGI